MNTEIKPRTTPTPWMKEGIQYRWQIIHRAPRKARVVAYTPDGTTEENEANAELICRAVNSYEEMLTALKACLHELGGDNPEDGNYANCEFLRDIIARAKGR